MTRQTSADTRTIAAILNQTVTQPDSQLMTASRAAPELVATIQRTDVSRLEGIGKLEFAAVTAELRRALAAYNADYVAASQEVAENVRQAKIENRLRMIVQCVLVLVAVAGVFLSSYAFAFSLFVLVGIFILRSIWMTRLGERAEALSHALDAPAAALHEKLGTSPAQARQAMWSTATGLSARADALYLASLDPAQRTSELKNRHVDAQQWADHRFARLSEADDAQTERSAAYPGFTVAC